MSSSSTSDNNAPTQAERAIESLISGALLEAVRSGRSEASQQIHNSFLSGLSKVAGVKINICPHVRRDGSICMKYAKNQIGTEFYCAGEHTRLAKDRQKSLELKLQQEQNRKQQEQLKKYQAAFKARNSPSKNQPSEATSKDNIAPQTPSSYEYVIDDLDELGLNSPPKPMQGVEASQ